MITVLMSVFNERIDFLKESIESVLNQTFSDFEFIIFDDASSSEVADVLNNYAEKDNRIKIVTNTENKGLTFNLNAGVRIAKGSFICRQDSDDISLPNRFEIELDYMLKHPEVGVAGSRFFSLKEGILKKVKTSPNLQNASFVKANLFFGNVIMHGSVIIRKEVLLNSDLNYDLRFKKSQDYQLWSKLCFYSNIVVLPKYLCVYRIHDNQISTNRNTRKEQQMFYTEILASNLGMLFDHVDEAMVNSQLSLISCDKKHPLKHVYRWCNALKKQNNRLTVYEKRVFNRLVNRFLFRFVLKKQVKDL